jgi:putative aldouronate transport system permease protein
MMKLRKTEAFGLSVVHVLLILIAFSTLYPFLYVVMYSFSDSKAAMSGGLFLWPKKPTLVAFSMVMKTQQLYVSYLNTIYITVGGTVLSILVTALTAYPLSISGFIGKNAISMLIYFTMLFSGGMIPSYLLVRDLGLLDSRWSLILPSLVSAYNMFIMRNFFHAVPSSLRESACMDGASEVRILVQIMLPVSLPALAVQAMFYGIAYWNTFFESIMYINDTAKQTLQVYLRTLINMSAFAATGSAMDKVDNALLSEETMKMAAIASSVIPIIIVYPLLQKYYIKGVLVGAIKG